jgi:hypothetical protein
MTRLVPAVLILGVFGVIGANRSAAAQTLLRSETVNGVVANAYKVHSESDGAVSDGTVWIAPSLGLPVKTEEDIAPSIGPKMHLSITWDYANIHAPVVK